MQVNKNSMIALTSSTRGLGGLTHEELNAIEALRLSGDIRAEELGMILKDPYVVQHVQSLYNKGLVRLNNLTSWNCPVCSTLNASSTTDPHRVTCSNCRGQFTVTGRHITGELLVQKLATRR